jgi:uncharacterized protein
MNILLTGSSGLVGRALADRLGRESHRVIRLVRQSQAASKDRRCWEPAAGRLEPSAVQDVDVVIHLAGENIAAGRWTSAQKARIRDSRVVATRLLCETMARSDTRPKLLISASAIGWYGDRGEEDLDEQSAPGAGFLADVCRHWEAATQPAVDAGVRTVNLRIGMVLSAAGGALAKMLPLFRLGLGGCLGSGRQYMSWITLEDLSRAAMFLLERPEIAGPVNATSPNPVTNREFTKALGQVLRRPTLLPAPAFALRMAMGEMADALLLASARVLPRRLQAGGFAFEYPDLSGALRSLIQGRP